MLAYRLANHFRRPVSELDISVREFYHWIAYLKLHPPDDGDNQRTAALMATITNMSGKSVKQSVKAEDFYQKPQPKQRPEDQMDFLRAFKDGS